MKKRYDVRKALAVPLTPEEQRWEDAIDAAEPPTYADAATVEKFAAAAGKALRELRRGGARAGAGRKPRPHVRTTVLLAPAVRAKLERLAKREGSLSAAVEKLVRSA